jgi:hypothetical protein
MYVELDVNYADDDKILRVSEGAELLYVRALCYAKRLLSDGFISDAQLRTFVMDETEERATALVKVGLWERVPGGYLITSWHKHNRPADEIRERSAGRSEGGREANHRRWHVGKGLVKPGCEWCDRSPIGTESVDRVPTDIGTESSSVPVSASTSVPTPTDRPMTDDRPMTTALVLVPEVLSATPTDRFDEWWGLYPKKVGKLDAQKAWAKAMKKKVDPQLIIDGQHRYNASKSVQDGYIANPATWLNAERWNDEVIPAHVPVARPKSFDGIDQAEAAMREAGLM